LRVQSNASTTEQLERFEREWASERILRAKLAVLESPRAVRDPVRLSYAAVVEIGDILGASRHARPARPP